MPIQQMLLGGAAAAVTGQIQYTSENPSPATKSGNWTCPDGVTSVSVLCIGGGSDSTNGTGGGLGWKNNIPVTPGNTYAYQASRVGGSPGGPAQDSFFIDTSTVKGGAGPGGQGSSGGTYTGDGGGNGGGCGNSPGGYAGAGGGGGYDGKGGDGGSDGGGTRGAGGGGVGLYGEGASGAGSGNGQAVAGGGGGGGTGNNTNPSGQAGSGGQTGSSGGGDYGGGTSDIVNTYSWPGGNGPGGGAVRIIWPGDARQFPTTRTADEQFLNCYIKY